jgi:hypothetical protein
MSNSNSIADGLIERAHKTIDMERLLRAASNMIAAIDRLNISTVDLRLAISETRVSSGDTRHNPNAEFMVMGIPAALPNISGVNDTDRVAGYEEGRP